MINPYNFLPGNPDNPGVLSRLIADGPINSMGYRAPEFNEIDWPNSVVIFGCSAVYGTGLTNSETISAQLENFLGRPVINMGVPASSITYSYANQLALAEQNIIPYAVINFWTSTKRQTYFVEKNIAAHTGPWIQEKDKQGINFRFHKKFFELWNFHNYNPNAHSNLYRTSARLLWRDTRYLEYSFFKATADFFDIKLIEQIDFGSDNSHPGVRTTFKTAKMLKENLESK